MSRKMQLRRLANMQAATARRERIRQQREARARLEWELWKLKFDSGIRRSLATPYNEREIAEWNW